MKCFDEFDEYIEKLLLVQFNASEIIKHNLTKGEIREDFLKEEVNKQFEYICYHKGFIIDNDNDYQSGQLDIIVTNGKCRTRKFGEQSMVDIKDAKIVLEVKSCAKTCDFKKLDRVAKEIKQLSNYVKVGMFCYSYSIQEQNLLKKFGYRYDKEIESYIDDKSLDNEFQYIDFVLALDCENEEDESRKNFFLIKDNYSGRYVLRKKEPVTKDFFMLFTCMQ